jgi:hypothetical protein
VKFTVGSSKVSPNDQEQLKQLAQTASSLTGYLVEAMGYTDAAGSATMNTKLSEELMQEQPEAAIKRAVQLPLFILWIESWARNFLSFIWPDTVRRPGVFPVSIPD